MTCAYDHPDFRIIALSFILKKRTYISIIKRNGMTVDEFIEDVRSNVWKCGEKDLAPTTIICNQIRWYIGRINGKMTNNKQLFNETKSTSDKHNIDNIEEVNKIFNLKCLSERELSILKMRHQGSNDSQISKVIGKSRETVKQIFRKAAKKVRKEYDKVLD